MRILVLCMVMFYGAFCGQYKPPPEPPPPKPVEDGIVPAWQVGPPIILSFDGYVTL